MKNTCNYLMIMVLFVCVMCCVSCKPNTATVYCQSGETQACYCPDGTEKEQVCMDDGSGWAPCDCTEYTVWNDPATNLSWQDPQKDAYTPNDPGLTQPDAIRYCEELVMKGYDDWRLPNIDELRTIIRGNPGNVTGGDCPVHDGSARADMYDPACAPGVDYEGPGSGGCYWASELTGPCNKPDPAAEGHPLETVSSTVASDDQFWVGCVLFDQGAAAFNHLYSVADVRCVRNGPTTPVTCEEGAKEACAPGETRQCTAANEKTGAQVCADDGRCWGPCESTEFTPSPPITDVCPQCDQLNLTIKVSEKLKTPMKMLLAFLFRVEDYSIPPKRPPDGGVDYDQVINPDIDVDKPLKLNVPACSYYRDRCIPSGDYYLYISLLQSEDMPPFPKEGDYVCCYDQPVLTLGTGIQQVIEKEITLVPYH